MSFDCHMIFSKYIHAEIEFTLIKFFLLFLNNKYLLLDNLILIEWFLRLEAAHILKKNDNYLKNIFFLNSWYDKIF